MYGCLYCIYVCGRVGKSVGGEGVWLLGGMKREVGEECEIQMERETDAGLQMSGWKLGLEGEQTLLFPDAVQCVDKYTSKGHCLLDLTF